MQIKHAFSTVIILAALLLPGVACEAKAKAKAVPAPATDSPAAAEQTMSRAEMQQLIVVRDCYVGCSSKIKQGVIPRSEGMACIDLCISDALAAQAGPGRLTGQLYVKYADGRIEKGLKVPIRLLSLAGVPDDAPKDVIAMRDSAIGLINTALSSDSGAVCAALDEYEKCGYGLEPALARFSLSAGDTDIDEGTFTVGGIPEGSYVLWVDWFKPNTKDINAGSLYRWLIPFRIGDQRTINVELNEKNISYILLNFPRAMYKP
jgi:hypothetical protein